MQRVDARKVKGQSQMPQTIFLVWYRARWLLPALKSTFFCEAGEYER